MLVYIHTPTKFEHMVWPSPDHAYTAVLGGQSHPTRNTEFLKTERISRLVPLKLRWARVSWDDIKHYAGYGTVDLGRGAEFAFLMHGGFGQWDY